MPDALRNLLAPVVERRSRRADERTEEPRRPRRSRARTARRRATSSRRPAARGDRRRRRRRRRRDRPGRAAGRTASRTRAHPRRTPQRASPGSLEPRELVVELLLEAVPLGARERRRRARRLPASDVPAARRARRPPGRAPWAPARPGRRSPSAACRRAPRSRTGPPARAWPRCDSPRRLQPGQLTADLLGLRRVGLVEARLARRAHQLGRELRDRPAVLGRRSGPERPERARDQRGGGEQRHDAQQPVPKAAHPASARCTARWSAACEGTR